MGNVVRAAQGSGGGVGVAVGASAVEKHASRENPIQVREAPGGGHRGA